jgi:hypothetical protein
LIKGYHFNCLTEEQLKNLGNDCCFYYNNDKGICSKCGAEYCYHCSNYEPFCSRRCTPRQIEQIYSGDAVDELIYTFKHALRDVERRNHARGELRERGNEWDPLAELEEADMARLDALNRLGFSDDERVVPLTIEALEDADLDIRLLAAELLGNYGAGKAVEPLIKAYNKDESKLVREAALVSLATHAEFGEPGAGRAGEFFLGALEDEDWFDWGYMQQQKKTIEENMEE